MTDTPPANPLAARVQELAAAVPAPAPEPLSSDAPSESGNPFAARVAALRAPGAEDPAVVRETFALTQDLRPGPTVERAGELEAVREARLAVTRAETLLSQGVRPDVVAEIRRMSREEELPLPLAMQTYMDRAAARPGASYRRLLRQNPGLRSMAVRGQQYADFMEDAEALSVVEQAWGAARASYAAVDPLLTPENAFNSLIREPVVGFGRSLTVSLPRFVAEVNDIAARSIARGVRTILPEDLAADLDAAGEQFSALQEQLGIPLNPSDALRNPAEVLDTIFSAIETPEDQRTFTTDLGNAVGQFGALATIALLSGGTAATVAGFGLSVDEQAQRVAAADAAGTLRGDVGILTAAGVNAAIERLNLDIIFDRIPQELRTRIVRSLATGTSEGVTETLQAISSNVVALGVYDPETGVFDGAAYEGLLGGIVGAMYGALLPGRPRLSLDDQLPPEIVERLNPDALPTAQQQAEAAAAALETARAAVEETRTFDRDPEAVRELLVEAGDAEVSIPAAEIERLYQEGALTDEAIEYLQLADDLTAQGQLSGDVVVPASRVLTAPGDSFAALVEHVRTSPSSPTLAEARDAVANREADIERLQGVLEQAEATVGEVNTLADTIFDQLRATQTLSRGQSRAAARLLAERYAARAALFEPGTTAQSLYEADRVQFERADQAGQGMQQAAQTIEVDGVPLPLNPDGTVTLYHGTTAPGAQAIRAEGRLRSAAEPSVYLTTEPTAAPGYGDGTVVAVNVDPALLRIDDEFPDGRADFAIDAPEVQVTFPAEALEQAAADIGSARALLAESPEALGLDAQLAASVNPIYRPEALPPGRMKGSNREAAEFLESTYADEPITDLTAEISPERLDRIATLMAAETQLALENTGNAADWYSAALDRTLDVAAVKYPMLTSDAAAEAAGFGTASNARFVFTYIMATTSQNLDVASNARATDTAFEQMLERWAAGDYTMKTKGWGTGDKKKAMNENFAKFNRMLPKMPGDTVVERLAAMDRLFRQDKTVGEWTSQMAAAGIPYSPPGQTAVDAVVYGSSTLGPKIGNGFWQNLNGNFEPLTIDLWMRRTWGRMTGKSIGLDDALPGQRARLKAAVARSRSRRNDVDAYVAELQTQLDAATTTLDTITRADFGTKKAFDAEQRRLRAEASSLREIIADAKGVKAPEPYRAEYNRDNPALLEYAKRLLKVWDAEYKRLVAEYGADNVPADLQPTWARAAKTIKANLGSPLDQVANGTQRRQIESAGRLAIQKLADRGITVTMADMQALLWYPEKELWSSLTRKLDVDEDGVPIPITSNLNESYDAAFTRILGDQGYEVERGTRAGSGAAGDRTVLEQSGLVGDGDQGADGEAVRAVRQGGGRGSYSGGGLAPLEGAPNVVGASGPDPNLVAVAEQYAARNGIDLRRQSEFVEVDPERAARIAQAYEEMEHAPQDPAVQEAYENLIAQTVAQYRALVEAGYSFTFFDSETDPYDGNPWNAMRDLRANKTMAVYGTYDGYGTEGLTDSAVEDNPMLQDTGLVWPDQNGVERPVTANDLFRAVHDAFGHGIEGAGFRARGEENAWQAHVRLFTGSAVAAITSETRGQNSWLNYGPYGEQNRTAGVEDTVFAEQKTGLMPEWTWTEGRAGDAPIQEQADVEPPTLLEQGISPDPAAVRGRRAGEGAERAPERAGADPRLADEPDGDTREQPVTGEDLGRLDDEAFLREFLTRPGWGAVTATLALPDDAFYRRQREESPASYERSLQRQAEQNERENERLRQMLEAQGIPYLPVQGMYMGEPDGVAYIIVADEATVMRLGRTFLQDSVLTRDGLIFTSRPRADVPATGDVMVGQQALSEDFYSVTPGGTQFSMGLGFGTGGPGVPRIPEGYTTRADRPQLPIRPDGLLELFHWSGSELSTVDPSFAGTGPLQGAERARGARTSFFGINPRESVRAQGTGYVREFGLGPVRHVAFVDPSSLYPLFEDPDGIAADKDISAAEAAIREAGYLGYYTTDDGSGRAALGNVAVLFEAVPVQVVPDAQPALEQPTPGPQTPSRGAVGAPRGAYRLPTNDDPRNIIELTANSDASTFVHEVGHMFLFQMLRDLQDTRLTADGRARLEADIAATRSWFASNAEQGLADLEKMARDVRKRADADAGNAQLQLRASRLEAAVQRAQQGGGAAYMQRVAEAFLDPNAQGYDEAAEVVFHELWARGFEQYLGSGSAPSESLRTVFARFAKYITNIYKSLRRLNVTVSPEVADVFDRLVATEDAIAQERRGATYQLSPGVLDGATPAEARELRRLAAEAEEEATTQMARREENALKRQERDRRAARREALTNEITEQVAREPAYAAMSIAATGRLPDGTETGTGKISRAEVEFVADAATADRIPRRVISGRTAPANAIPLADLAMLSGFPDIDSLVTALSDPNMRSLQDEVAARVDAQMQAEFGAETDPDALRDQAIEAVQNTKFQQLQQLQLRILRRLAAEPLARVSRRQAEQVGAPPAAADTAAERAAEAEQAAARTPREGVQSALARIRANVQRQANVPQRRAQAAATRQTRGIQRNIDPAAITEAAARYVAALEVGKATPARYRQAAQRLTVKIERAIAARNYSEASSLMEQRALNLAVAQEAARVQTKVEAQRKRWRQVLARPDKRLATSYDMNWVNAIRVLLEPLDFARVNNRNFKAEDALAELQAVEPALYADIMNQISAAGRDAQLAAQADPKQPHRALSVTRMMEIFDLANQLLANARNTHGLLVEGRRVEFGKIAAEAASYIDNRREVQRRAAKPPARPSRFREAWADMTAGFRATLRRVEILARDLDNGDARGPVTRYLVRPVMAAVDAYSEARLEPLQRLGDLLKDRGDLLKAKEIKADELAPGWSFRNKGELLMAVLNTGNESNLRKLLMGGGRVGEQWSAWTSTQTSAEELDTSRWDAFLDRMFAEGVLTKDDMDAVQGIWDIFEDTKSGAQAAHQRMFGYRFVEVEASPVQTPVGTYRGGYVPAVLDRFMNPGSDKYEVQEVMSQQANASMFPGAEKGFTQARTDATYVIDLDITRLPMHFDRVMKFTHLGPAVQQAARLVNNAEFAAQIARVNPRLTRDALIPWLKRTVQQQVAAPSTTPGLRLISRGAEVLDRRVGMHIMAANLKNAAEQMTGFFPALARIPAKHLLAAGTTWKLDGASARRHMLEVSPFMRQRIEIGANETLNLIDNIMREPGLLSRAQDAAVRYSYFAQQLVASAMEPTIWLAAERQAMETIYPAAYADALARTGDDAEADTLAKAEVYAYADEVVRTTQGSTRPSDVSGIEGTTALMRIFLRFYSFFNAQGNSFVAERNIAMNRDMGWAGRNGRAFYAYAMILAVPAILSKMLGTALQGGYDDLDEEEATQLAFEALIGSQVEMAAGTIPFLGQAASIPYGVLFTDSPFDDGIRGSAGLSVASRAGVDVVRLIADIADPETDVETVQAARTTLNATGLLLGLPTNWLSKPLAYAERVEAGEADPEGLVDIVQGILTGRDGTER